jgi:dephospho-CoA kinase
VRGPGAPQPDVPAPGPGARPLLIGLTGPIGCGKSTVAAWLAELDGVEAIDADDVARAVLDPGTTEVEAVYRRFGADLRGPDGTLDRAGLGRIVFADPVALADLEAIVHPAVRPRILALVDDAAQRGRRAVVIEAIKLVEGGLAAMCDEVWLVTCSAAEQRTRLASRGLPPEDAAARIEAQGDLVGRIADQASRVIDSSGSADATRSAAQAALEAALTAARTDVPSVSPRA